MRECFFFSVKRCNHVLGFTCLYVIFTKSLSTLYPSSSYCRGQINISTRPKGPAYYHTERFISYRKYILQITQPSQCTQLQYRYSVISEAPSRLLRGTYSVWRGGAIRVQFFSLPDVKKCKNNWK